MWQFASLKYNCLTFSTAEFYISHLRQRYSTALQYLCTTTTLIVTGTEYTFAGDLLCLRVDNQNRVPEQTEALHFEKCLPVFFASTYRKQMDIYCSA